MQLRLYVPMASMWHRVLLVALEAVMTSVGLASDQCMHMLYMHMHLIQPNCHWFTANVTMLCQSLLINSATMCLLYGMTCLLYITAFK